MQALYKEIGGVLIGKGYWLNAHASWPFGGIEIYHDKLIVRLLWFKTTIMKYEITSIDKYGLFKTGIKITHNNKSKNRYLVYSSFNPKKILQKLMEAGYEVKH
ncbi:MAG: hypothetical protein ABIH82_05445 [Candidatus Woesearchaeota archaeon]